METQTDLTQTSYFVEGLTDEQRTRADKIYVEIKNKSDPILERYHNLLTKKLEQSPQDSLARDELIAKVAATHGLLFERLLMELVDDGFESIRR